MRCPSALGVTTDSVWAQARAGRIPQVQLERYRRFREEAQEVPIERSAVEWSVCSL